MKYLGLIALACAVLGIVACGDDASSGESESSEGAKLTKPKVEPPAGPPPTELVVNDIEEGEGEEAEEGDKLGIFYVGVNEQGKEIYNNWGYGGTLSLTLGGGDYGQGFEEGLEGMKAGGRRELLIPEELAFDNGPVFYVVDLVRVE